MWGSSKVSEWRSHSTFLSLKFLSYQRGTMIASASEGCGKNELRWSTCSIGHSLGPIVGIWQILVIIVVDEREVAGVVGEAAERRENGSMILWHGESWTGVSPSARAGRKFNWFFYLNLPILKCVNSGQHGEKGLFQVTQILMEGPGLKLESSAFLS